MGNVASCCESCFGSGRSQGYEPLSLENEREPVADLFHCQYLDNEKRTTTSFFTGLPLHASTALSYYDNVVLQRSCSDPLAFGEMTKKDNHCTTVTTLINKQLSTQSQGITSMSTFSGTVLVTGGTGFLGSHTIAQLLDRGLPVRAVARSATKLQQIFPDAGDQLETVEIESLLADYTEALKGVSAVIHIASPTVASGASAKEIFQGIYEGTLNIVRQAISSGVKKIVTTGTYSSPLDEIISEDFGATHKPDEQTPGDAYQTAKRLVDRKIWEIAREHPDVDFTIILPPGVYGPFVPNFPYPTSADSLGSNARVYSLITNGPNTYPPLRTGHLVDVRDGAKAHVNALYTPPVQGRNKRFIISATPCQFTWKEAAEFVRKERPELASRLPDKNAKYPPQIRVPLDVSFARDVLGMKEYIPWGQTILAALDVGLEFERRSKL
ncbi:NAD(P)-binding protein [Marasmius fiardii PR-910]|nr:NAD(P)-binding protein [Marasmius fiardii PR-910]